MKDNRKILIFFANLGEKIIAFADRKIPRYLAALIVLAYALLLLLLPIKEGQVLAVVTLAFLILLSIPWRWIKRK